MTRRLSKTEEHPILPATGLKRVFLSKLILGPDDAHRG